VSPIVARTARLVLREYALDDEDALAHLLGDPTTMAHWPEPLTAAQSRAWLDRALAAYAVPGYGRWAVQLHDGTYIGDAGIMRSEVDGVVENDLGYIIHSRYWRQGYGVEAAQGCIDVALAAGMHRMVANMAADNLGSVRVAQRLGFQLTHSFENPRNLNKTTHVYVLEFGASDRER
jgi:RimJ/RimL family protein N-acetyltransferase